MTVLRVDDFGGMAPAMNPRNLPPNGAVESINADVRRSALVPIQKGGSVNYVDLPELRPLALFDFPNAIGKLVLKYSAAKWMSEVSEGVYAKWRITDNNVAYVTEGNNPQEVQTISPGVPDPAAAPNVTDSSPNSPQDTAYVVTYVKRAHGIDFESAPSAPATTSQSTGASVTLAFAERNRTDFDKFRVYRTSGGKFLFAAEKGKSETFVDNVSADALGEEVPSADWEYFTTYLWPVNTSFGSIAAIYHGLGDTVAFTEIGIFHAWPRRYRLRLPDQIQALVDNGDSIAAFTNSNVYMLSGTGPDSVSAREVGRGETGRLVCLPAKCSQGVAFWTTTGVFVLTRAGALHNLTQGRMLAPPQGSDNSLSSRRRIFELDGVICVADPHYDGSLINMVRLRDGKMAKTEPLTMFPSESGDKAFFVDSEDQFTQMFSGSNRFTAKWKSKEFETPSRTGFSCAKVDVRPYTGSGTRTCTLQIWRDGSPVWSSPRAIADSKPFRLPPGRGLVWQFEVVTNCEVTAVTLATSMKELSRV